MDSLLYGWQHVFKKHVIAGVMFLFFDSAPLAAQFEAQLKAHGANAKRFGSQIQLEGFK